MKQRNFRFNLLKSIVLILMCIICSCICAQEISIRGVVKDIQGEPLIGATIVVVGSTNGTTTDINGNFTLNGVSTTSVLKIDYVGMQQQSVTVKEKRFFNITMSEDTKLLDEVVVVGYGTQKKGMLTGSISNVKNEKLTTAPIANVTNMLGGQLPGVIAKQEGGLPGSDSSSLNIRGFGIPLIIVDGVESSLNNIDANQIASISVLKDGAASIYGARAGNGVILITTKRGTKTDCYR